MVDLVVRDVDEDIVRALTKQAGRHGRSAEAEHLAILAAALGRPEKPCFADVRVNARRRHGRRLRTHRIRERTTECILLTRMQALTGAAASASGIPQRNYRGLAGAIFGVSARLADSVLRLHA